MTKDQETRLIEAFNNVEHLVTPEDFIQLIADTIAVFNGYAGTINEREDNMARPKGSSNKKKAAVTIEGQPEALQTSISVPADRDQLIAEWKAAADQLGELKAKEHALRQAIVAQCFDGKKLEGSETVDLGFGGWALRAVKELAYNATDKNGESRTVQRLLDARGFQGALFRWQPDVAKKTYKEVLSLAEKHNDTEILAALHAAIVLKPGMPQLELVPPKQDEPAAPAETPVAQPPVWNGVIEDNFLPE